MKADEVIEVTGVFMLFDSEKISALRSKYCNADTADSPEIIRLDRSQELVDERNQLERIIQALPQEKQKKLVGEFLSKRDGSHLGAWFELMLYDWLQHVGHVEIEPEVEGDFPDFGVRIDDSTIYLEARVIVQSEEINEQDRLLSNLNSLLSNISPEYVVSVQVFNLNDSLNKDDLKSQVVNWLNSEPTDELSYEDGAGNKLMLRAAFHSGIDKIGVHTIGEMLFVNPDGIKGRIKKKAKQHKNLRRANLPYVLAIYLESFIHSPEDVVSAWFGNEQFSVDIETGDVIESSIDFSGMHFRGREILHKSVSGTLVFKAVMDKNQQTRRLQAWYIENPFANTQISTNLFPVEAVFRNLISPPN